MILTRPCINFVLSDFALTDWKEQTELDAGEACNKTVITRPPFVVDENGDGETRLTHWREQTKTPTVAQNNFAVSTRTALQGSVVRR